MGDFNTPLQESEKFGGFQVHMDSKQDLANFINEQCLIDLHLSGAKYTWTNRRMGDELIQVSLDRTLISTDWLHHYFFSLNSISKIRSDHFPISFLVEPKGGKRKFPFRFEKMWLSHPSLYSSIKSWWYVEIDGTALFCIAKKLKVAKEKDRKWNKETFVDIYMIKYSLQSELNLIQDQIKREGYVGDNFSKESEILSKYHNIISREEIFWKQCNLGPFG